MVSTNNYHNNWNGLQGGNSAERYHLDSDTYTFLNGMYTASGGSYNNLINVNTVVSFVMQGSTVVSHTGMTGPVGGDVPYGGTWLVIYFYRTFYDTGEEDDQTDRFAATAVHIIAGGSWAGMHSGYYETLAFGFKIA